MSDRSSAGAKLAIGIDTDVLLIVRGILTKGKQTTLYSTYRRMVGRTIYTMHSAMSSYRVLIDNLVCARTHNRELSHPCVTDVYTFNYVVLPAVCKAYRSRRSLSAYPTEKQLLSSTAPGTNRYSSAQFAHQIFLR